MVKDFYLGLFATIVCALAALTYAVPVSKVVASRTSTSQPQYIGNGSLSQPHTPEDALTDDGSIRSERSTNLSHITGSARKIRMYVKNRHLQVLPDGTVNGTSDDTDYTILQRTTVNIGQLKIQGVATCQYLCMDSCGLLYGSKEFLDECVFNEMIEQSNYNTYSSALYSNSKRTMYLALNKRGQSRKVLVKAKQQLGKLSKYARVLTQPVTAERVDDLVNRLLITAGGNSSHPLRHHGSGSHLCSVGGQSQPSPGSNNGLVQSQTLTDKTAKFGNDTPGVDRLRCRKRRKRKKKRRRCGGDGDDELGKSAAKGDGISANGNEDADCIPVSKKKHEGGMKQGGESKQSKKKQSSANSGKIPQKNNTKNIQQKCERANNKQDVCQRIDTNKLVTVKKNQNKKNKLGDTQLHTLRVVKKKGRKHKTIKNNKREKLKIVSEEVNSNITVMKKNTETTQDSLQLELSASGVASDSASPEESSAMPPASAEQPDASISVASTSSSYNTDTAETFFLSTSPLTD